MPDAPVILIVFNRPRETRQVLDALAAYAPRRLYVVADHPRGPQDEAACDAVLRLFDQLPWPGEVILDRAERNLGCRHRVESGLNAVFAREERAIILEDDCVAHPDFFRYCNGLLDRYADDEQIMHIGGNNFQRGQWRGDGDYYFSRQTHCWGWATWARAWRHYDGGITRWPSFRNSAAMRRFWTNPAERAYYRNILDQVYAGEIDSWAYRWGLTVAILGGWGILPNRNLVRNIGIGEDATHTREDRWFMNLPVEPLDGLRAPSVRRLDDEADRETFIHTLHGDEWEAAWKPAARLRRGLGRWLKRITG